MKYIFTYFYCNLLNIYIYIFYSLLNPLDKLVKYIYIYIYIYLYSLFFHIRDVIFKNTITLYTINTHRFVKLYNTFICTYFYLFLL